MLEDITAVVAERDAALARLNADTSELARQCIELTAMVHAEKARIAELIDTRRMWVERHGGPCGLVACPAAGPHEHLCGLAAKETG